MKVSITKFIEHFKIIDGCFYQHTIHDEIDHLHGILEFNHKGCFPIYNVENDKWYSFEDDEDSWGEYEMEYNYRADGKFDFTVLGDGEYYSSFYLYNPIELKQFVSIVNKLPKTDILNFPYLHKEFKFSDVIKKLYVTVKDNTGRIKLCDLNTLKEKLPYDDFRSFLRAIFSGDSDFLVNIGGNWYNYCEEQNIPILDLYYGNISLLYNGSFINITNPYINFEIPYLAFELLPDFSSQYFCDLMVYSKDGKVFIDSLINSIIEGKLLKTMSIAAPKDFISQFLYSSAFRWQYNYYLQVSNNPNFSVEQMIDLKSICVNLRENFQEYFLNKDKSNFLDTIKHPLPFILEKTYRSYLRATGDFDRQTYGGRLFNYILRSIVIYPIQELVYLKFNETHPGINKVLTEIQSGNLISDGTWITWFNDIAKIIGKDASIELDYFNILLNNIQKLYKDIQESIPKRNDWAHYRDHSVEYQKHLDNLLPKLIYSIRESLKNIDIIYIEKQEFKSSNELFITAKKIMGYEIDIETIEFLTKLPGSFFISKKLYAYKKGSNYTIPLEPFFDIKFETVQTIKMGIFENNFNGEYKYVY
jgi:hypothetical protein